jgi:hypothetical protein
VLVGAKGFAIGWLSVVWEPGYAPGML